VSPSCHPSSVALTGFSRNTLIDSLPANLVPTPAPATSEQMDRATWPALAKFLTAAFLSQPRQFWTELFLNTDACCVPVLDRSEVDAYGLSSIEPGVNPSDLDGQGDGGIPTPAPKLSRTPASGLESYREGDGFFLTPGQHSRDVLLEAGLGGQIQALAKSKAIDVGEEDEVKSKL
jgi:alpha-methylacyl-CoA racemase